MHNKLYILCELIFTDEDDLETVVNELSDIADVERLGLNLGLRMSALKKIRIDYPQLEEQKTNVIFCWLQRRDIVQQRHNEHPTWGELAHAVHLLNPSLSGRIRHKHC